MSQETSAVARPTEAEEAASERRFESRPSEGDVPTSLVPEQSWHFLHLFYKIDRAALRELDPESSTYKEKVAGYAERLGPLIKRRLNPDFPDWPCLCFYPMSKMRDGDQNWYMLPFDKRSELMGRHGKLGRTYAGKVEQLVTGSTGLDDWEWGVTLWARNPVFLKDIVHSMRFDEASAKYGLFGDFYFGYILPPAELADTLRI